VKRAARDAEKDAHRDVAARLGPRIHYRHIMAPDVLLDGSICCKYRNSLHCGLSLNPLADRRI
jgi:hypothetical protein